MARFLCTSCSQSDPLSLRRKMWENISYFCNLSESAKKHYKINLSAFAAISFVIIYLNRLILINEIKKMSSELQYFQILSADSYWSVNDKLIFLTVLLGTTVEEFPVVWNTFPVSLSLSLLSGWRQGAVRLSTHTGHPPRWFTPTTVKHTHHTHTEE